MLVNQVPTLNDKNEGLAVIIKNTLINALSLALEKEQPKHQRVWVFNSLYPKKFRIFVMYNKNTKNNVLDVIETFSLNDHNILLGDINSFPTKHMDQISTTTNPANNTQTFSVLVEKGWVDTFRYVNPDSKAFSKTDRSNHMIRLFYGGFRTV